MAHDGGVSRVLHFPDEVVLCILSFLPGTQACRVSTSCTSWYHALHESTLAQDAFWKSLFTVGEALQYLNEKFPKAVKWRQLWTKQHRTCWNWKAGYFSSFPLHSRAISCSSFAFTDAHLASVSEDGKFRFFPKWSKRENECFEFKDTDLFSFVTISGHAAALGTDSSFVRVLRVSSSGHLTEKAKMRKNVSGAVCAMSFLGSDDSGDHTHIASTTACDRAIDIWSLNSLPSRSALTGHNDVVSSLTWSEELHVLASGSADEEVRLWDVDREHCTSRFGGHEGEIYQVCIVPFARPLIASTSCDTTVKLWSDQVHTRGGCVATLRAHHGPVLCCDYYENTLVTGGFDQTAKIWDLRQLGHPLQSMDMKAAVASLQINWRYLVAGFGDSRIPIHVLDFSKSSKHSSAKDIVSFVQRKSPVKCPAGNSAVPVNARDHSDVVYLSRLGCNHEVREAASRPSSAAAATVAGNMVLDITDEQSLQLPQANATEGYGRQRTDLPRSERAAPRARKKSGYRPSSHMKSRRTNDRRGTM